MAALAVFALPKPAEAGSGTQSVWLQPTRDLYPHRAAICLQSYTQRADPPGVILSLQSEVEQFSHYRYTLQRDSSPTGSPHDSRDGSIEVTFDADQPRSQQIVVTIEAVSLWGRRSSPFSITIAYHPRAVYAAAHQSSPSWIIVEASDLSLCGTRVDDWVVENSWPESRAYARKRWGDLVKALRGDHERAKAIAHDLVRSLEPHSGIPSSRMQDLPAFEQLARAEAGLDHVWCSNYAEIFSAACNEVGIAARKIDMQYLWSSEAKTGLEIAEAHRTTEIFDRGLDRWVWMDLTFDILGAELCGEMVNLAEMVEALHDKRRIQHLTFVEYDPIRGIESEVPAQRSRHLKDLLRFFRTDQRYQYTRRVRS